MTEATQTQVTELEQLKAQADELGLVYPNRVTTKALKKLIAEALLKDTDADNSEEIQAVEDDALKLVNVIVMPTDASKTNVGHETFMVGNSVLGVISRIVPFGKPWLIENILYKHIISRERQIFIEHEDPKIPGKIDVESRLVPAYSVQVLPLPTKEEIEELAKRQQARNAVE